MTFYTPGKHKGKQMNFQEAKEEWEKGNKTPLIDLIIKNQLPVLNSLESHLGCALCHGPLGGEKNNRCPVCQGEDGKYKGE